MVGTLLTTSKVCKNFGRKPAYSGLAAALVCSASFSANVANAEPMPTNKLVTSSLVSPSAAWTRFGNSTVHTAGLAASTTVSPRILALARGLGSERSDVSAAQYARNVNDYIRNNVNTEFRFGLGKGARGAVIDLSGTPFDQAELMAMLLQQKGIAATYHVGTITLNAQQFGQWTGFVSNLDEANQSFVVNAQAACQFLADGGVPAVVNGATDCSTATGNLSSVTMGHAWVEAGGIWFDPSFKRHVLEAGMDVATAAGCGSFSSSTCGAQVTTAAMTGATTGNIAGSPWVQNINKSLLASQLHNYAASIENYVRANAPLGDIVDVVGGSRSDLTYSPALTAGSLSYPASVQYSWVGGIPDQFRTTARLQFLDMDSTFFMDELSGRSLKYDAQTTSDNGLLLLDGQTLASTSCTATSTNCGLFNTTRTTYYSSSSSSSATYLSAYLKITFGHPYALTSIDVNQPVYQFVRQAIKPELNVILSLGNSSRSTEEYYAAMVGKTPIGSSNADLDKSDTATFASIRADQDSAARLVSVTEHVGFTRHHSLGLFESRYNYRTVSLISAESIQSVYNNAQRRLAAFEITNTIDTLLESRDPKFFSYSGASGSSAYDNAQGIKFISVSPSAFSSLSGSLTDYSTYDKSLLQSGALEGYSLIIPQDGRASCTSLPARPGDPTGSSTTVCPQSDAAPVIAYNGAASGYLIAARWKANSEPSPPLSDFSKRDFSGKDKKYFGLDLAKGALKLTPPPDLVTGGGNFPSSLSFQRTYDSSSSWYERYELNSSTGLWGTYYYGPEKERLPEKIGGGWSHNNMLYADMTTDRSAFLGETSGVAASTVLSAIMSLRGIYLANTYQSRLAGVFAADWLLSRMAYSSVSVKTPDGFKSFVRLPSGAFIGRLGVPAKLAVTGTYGGPYTSTQSGPSYGYVGLNVTYTDADGMTYLFPARDQSAPSTEAEIGSITGPTGVKVGFARTSSGQIQASVNNSLGRSLLLQTHDDAGYGGATNPSRLVSVTDDSGRVVSFQKDRCPVLSGYVSYTSIFVCNTYSVTLPDNSVIKYEYDSGGDSPDPATLTRSNFRIRRIYAADSQAVPFRTVGYDDVFRVAEVKDPLAHSIRVFPTSLFHENAHTTAQLDGAGAVSIVLFDGSGASLLSSDPLGRQSASVYDRAGRMLRTIRPEGNAVEYSYDMRGNRLTECQIAKGRVNWTGLTPITEQAPQCNAGAGDLVTTTGYMEGPTVRADQCANMKTCNKPSYVTDPKGNRTDYTWSATHGQMLTETKPADPSGIRPVTTYGYTAFTGIDGAIFYLLTSKQEKIDASRTTTTTWVYNGVAAKFTLKEQVVDSGGLSLRTCYKFDATGNLISKTEPRAGLPSCP